MSDSTQQTGSANDKQLSDETLESVAGGVGELRALPGPIDIKAPIIKLPGGDDGCYPIPVPLPIDTIA